MRLLLTVIACGLMIACFSHPEEAEFTWNVQYAHHENWERDDRGATDWESFSTELQQFPWLEQLAEVNLQGRTQPTVSVESTTANRFLSASIVGEAKDHAFYVFYGPLDTQEATRIDSLPDLDVAQELFRAFFNREYQSLDDYFSTSGISLQEFKEIHAL